MHKFTVLTAFAVSVVVGLLLLPPLDAKKVESEKKEWSTNACHKAFRDRQKMEESWTDEERKNSTAGKCFVACIMEKKGLVRRGSVDEKRLLEYVRATAKSVNAEMRRLHVDAEHWGQVARKCIQHVSSMNDCDLGYNVWHCLLFNMRDSTYRVPDSEDVQRDI